MPTKVICLLTLTKKIIVNIISSETFQEQLINLFYIEAIKMKKRKQKNLSDEEIRLMAKKAGGHVWTKGEMLRALKDGYCVWGCSKSHHKLTIETIYNLNQSIEEEECIVAFYNVSYGGSYEWVMSCVIATKDLEDFANAIYTSHDVFIADYQRVFF